MTYKDALAANGHDENTDVHYLKIDIEGTEMSVRKETVYLNWNEVNLHCLTF